MRNLALNNSPYARSGKKLSFLKKLSFCGTETTAKKLSFFKKLSFGDAVA
jgi:hypothetical protein